MLFTIRNFDLLRRSLLLIRFIGSKSFILVPLFAWRRVLLVAVLPDVAFLTTAIASYIGAIGLSKASALMFGLSVVVGRTGLARACTLRLVGRETTHDNGRLIDALRALVEEHR